MQLHCGHAAAREGLQLCADAVGEAIAECSEAAVADAGARLQLCLYDVVGLACEASRRTMCASATETLKRGRCAHAAAAANLDLCVAEVNPTSHATTAIVCITAALALVFLGGAVRRRIATRLPCEARPSALAVLFCGRRPFDALFYIACASGVAVALLTGLALAHVPRAFLNRAVMLWTQPFLVGDPTARASFAAAVTVLLVVTLPCVHLCVHGKLLGFALRRHRDLSGRGTRRRRCCQRLWNFIFVALTAAYPLLAALLLPGLLATHADCVRAPQPPQSSAHGMLMSCPNATVVAVHAASYAAATVLLLSAVAGLLRLTTGADALRSASCATADADMSLEDLDASESETDADDAEDDESASRTTLGSPSSRPATAPPLRLGSGDKLGAALAIV